jgi:hypothetical protein
VAEIAMTLWPNSTVMKRRLILTGLTVVLFSCFSSATAQKKPAPPKPDFSGEWLLDLKKTSKKWIPKRPDIPLKISHRDPELRVKESSEKDGKIVERESIYFTDERGETNQATQFMMSTGTSAPTGEIEKGRTKSYTRWSGNKIISVATLRMVLGARVVEYKVIDEWKLSDDGKVLTRISQIVFQGSDAMFVPAIVPDTKKVYNRT